MKPNPPRRTWWLSRLEGIARLEASSLFLCWFLWPAVSLAVVRPLVGQPPVGQSQFAELTGGHLPAAGSDTRAVLLVDLDADGDRDLVLANGEPFGPLAARNAVILNSGGGVFAAAPANLPPTAAVSVALVAVDLNADGSLDVVVGNAGAQNRAYINDGSGSFVDATAVLLPPDTDLSWGVAVGDVDGDGDADLVFANRGQQNRLYLRAPGRFVDATAGRLPAAVHATEAVALVDVDGDGDLDLVAANWGEQNRLYRNDGVGFFVDSTGTSFPVDVDGTSAVAVGDVDSDGDVDLVWGNNKGRDRLVVNDGRGVFMERAVALPARVEVTRDVVFGDVDGDGDLDLVAANARPPSRLYLNDGRGVFRDAAPGSLPPGAARASAVALADVDGDGDADLLLASSDGERNHLYLGDGRGVFLETRIARTPQSTSNTLGLALADLDGDGELDAVLANRAEQNELWLGDGLGHFVDQTGLLPQDVDHTHVVGVADLDTDGDGDLVWGTDFGGTKVYLNTGAGGFVDATAGRVPLLPDRTRALALRDVDGDGDVDIITGTVSGQLDRLLLNDGRAVFMDATAQLPAIRGDTLALACGDVDGDADVDMVVGTAFGAQTRLYLNDGSGVYRDATAGGMPVLVDATVGLVLVDVEGDGDLDLVAACSNRQNRLFVNDGSGVFRDATAGRMPPDQDLATALAAADVDSDGAVDLVVATGDGEPNKLYLNDGSGVFMDVTATRWPGDLSWVSSLAVEDVDLDGDPDVVLGRPGPKSLYLNLRGQVDCPTVPAVGRSLAVDVYNRNPTLGGSGSPSALVVMAPRLLQPGVPTSMGLLRLSPAGLAVVGWLGVPAATGVAQAVVSIPRSAALVGRTLFVQGGVVQGLAGAPVLTNAASFAIVRH